VDASGPHAILGRELVRILIDREDGTNLHDRFLAQQILQGTETPDPRHPVDVDDALLARRDSAPVRGVRGPLPVSLPEVSDLAVWPADLERQVVVAPGAPLAPQSDRHVGDVVDHDVEVPELRAILDVDRVDRPASGAIEGHRDTHCDRFLAGTRRFRRHEETAEHAEHDRTTRLKLCKPPHDHHPPSPWNSAPPGARAADR